MCDRVRQKRLELALFLSIVTLAWSSSPATAKKKEVSTFTPSGKWQAYFRDEEGSMKAVEEPREKYNDKEWMGLLFTDYFGPRLRLAVMAVENKTANRYGNKAPDNGLELLAAALLNARTGVEVPLSGIEELITTALFNTHRFDLIERKAVDAVIAEQDFGESGRVAEPTKATIGNIQGADYQIHVTINEWTPQKSSIGGGIGGGKLGGVGVGKKKAEVAMSFRVIDSVSSQVLYSITERAEAGSWGVGLVGAGGDGLGLGGMQKKAPIGNAVQACVNKAIYALAMWLKDRPWRGSVVQVSGDKVYVNAGSDAGITMGTEMDCLAKGEALVDPETGLPLGADLELIGSLKVTSVQEKFSIATILEGCTGLKEGDRVELRKGG